MTTHATLEELTAIRARIAPHIHRTPLWPSRYLSERTGYDVYLKAELFQRTGSYKPRGMLNKLMALSSEDLAAGTVTFSAGNAAQGLAYAAGILGAPATVVMPDGASPMKAAATRGYGGEVIFRGTAAEAFDLCQAMVAEQGVTMVSSFDDADLIKGNASLGLEIAEDLDGIDTIFVAIGGGGMAGGVGVAMEALGNGARLVGVEPSGAAGMTAALAAGEMVRLEKVESIADGLAAPWAGEIPLEIVQRRYEDVLVVEDDAIAEALKLIMTRCKLYVEPAGAASLAGLLSGRVALKPGAKVVCVLSGGNLDLERLKALL
jgi:threonine dehydratase